MSIAESPAGRSTQYSPLPVIRFTWLVTLRWLAALALGATATPPAGRVVGITLAFGTLDDNPWVAWGEQGSEGADRLAWRLYR